MTSIQLHQLQQHFSMLLDQVENTSNEDLSKRLKLIWDKRGCIDEKNVMQLIRIVKKYDTTSGNSIKQIIEKIRKKIFDLSIGDGKWFIYSFARAGEFEKVRALINIVSTDDELKTLLTKPQIQFNQNVVECAIQGRNQALIAYLNLPYPLLTKEIICKKGEDPKLEGLLSGMYTLNLKINYCIVYEDVKYHSTNCFTIINSSFQKRPLIFAFIEKENKLYPRLFWLSKSQATWRRLDKTFKDHIGKTRSGEERLLIPIRINLRFFEILNEQDDIQPLDGSLGNDFLQYVVAKSDKAVKKTPRTKDKKYHIVQDEQTLVQDEDSSVQDESGPFSLKPRETPENFFINGIPAISSKNDFEDNAVKPNFTKVERSQVITSAFYGRLRANVFLSNDENIRFLFLQNDLGHVFLAGAELINSPITRRGIRKKWVKLGSLSLPLKEYQKQFINEFISDSEKEEIRQGEQLTYVQTWNYLREMPCIQNYYAIPRQIQ
ncbi:hypothetical protein [Candidatus Protochlamydia amoebophila]|uniref:Uncharacterized protein n=1 Tax=Protochlamydia amoebophila (strain UWE25) TaxID=264201 RepID=Q6MBA8_PARUW|nr:hypothetical protein [Candidatus Protochlamydia amoebophila]CAF24141.1 unnamed protein product [Candidatus Protochlamydia amoebophila UWE25]